MNTIYHIRHKALMLGKSRQSYLRYLPTLASANIDLHPHQIAAALFASDKNAIIADEEGLGKTITAGIVLLDHILNGKDKLLVLAPKNLLSHWKSELSDKFGIDIVPLDSDDNGVVLLSYQDSVKYADKIFKIEWDLCVLDEAHILANANLADKSQSDTIHKILNGRRKLLLTATPMQNSLLDLYYLVRLIDDKTFGGSPELFKKKYIENKDLRYDLVQRAQQVCWRTLKRQALTMQLPKRSVRTILIQPTDLETELSKSMSLYFHRKTSQAFPKLQEQEAYIRLTFWKLLASGTKALSASLNKVLERLDNGEERDQLQSVKDLSDNIKTTARMSAFLKIVKESFVSLRQSKSPKKILVFSENKTTLAELYDRLKDKYKVVLSSSESTERDIKEFQTKADIMLAGDHLGKGLDLSFCCCVINYDVPWNVQKLEQRISRCHRYGQKHDCLVVNFIDPTNRADRRLYSVLNRKLKKFDEVFGASESVLGELTNGDLDIDLRTENEIKESVKLFESENQESIDTQIQQAESDLLAHFDTDIAAKFKFYAEQIPDKVREAEDILWEITKYILGRYAKITDNPREIFMNKMVFDGLRLSRLDFRMSPDAKRGERYDFKSPLASRVLSKCWDGELQYGNLIITASNEFPSGTSGIIGFWSTSAFIARDYKTAHIICGYTEDGRELSEQECHTIMQMPLVKYSGGRFDKDLDQPKRLDHRLETIRNRIQKIKTDEIRIEYDTELQSEIQKIEQWARDEIESLQLNKSDIGKESEALKSKPVSSFAEKFRLNKQLAQLKKQSQSMESGQQSKIDDVYRNKTDMIEKAKSRSVAQFNISEYFVVRFDVE